MNLLLIIAIVVIAFVLLKGYGLKHRMASWVMVIALLFVVGSVWYVLKHNALDFKSVSGVFNAIKIYFNWILSLGGNFEKISGAVTGIDWGGNATALVGE